MRLKFIGSGDAFGTDGRGNTCFLIERKPDEYLLIDCGASALPALKREHVDLGHISTIFVSHFHGDHYGAIPQFLLDAQILQKREKSLTIVGPAGIESRIWALQEAMYPGTSTMKFSFSIQFIEVNKSYTDLDSTLTVSYWPMVHAPQSNPHGIKLLVDGKTFGYTGDTEWHDLLPGFAESCDLLIMECFGFASPSPMHLNYELIKHRQSSLNAKSIYLTHIGPEIINNWDKIDLPVANDGQEIDF